MLGKRLRIDFSEDAGYAWFTTTEVYTASEEKHVVRVPEGFRMEDLHQAVLATGWVREANEDSLLVDRDVDCLRLGCLVEEMLFVVEVPAREDNESDGLCRSRLKRVRERMRRFSEESLTCWELAWLEIMVREDLADLVRTSEMIWGTEPIRLDVCPVIEHRLEQLRLRRKATMTPRLTPSERQPRPANRSAG
jgi:hypothetical protein